jgi:hypothetical protein
MWFGLAVRCSQTGGQQPQPIGRIRMALRIEDLSAEQIRAVLALYVNDLTDDEILTIQDFIERIGGRENAELTVKMLGQLERPNGGSQKKHGGTD